jgi:hypothetical protein
VRKFVVAHTRLNTSSSLSFCATATGHYPTALRKLEYLALTAIFESAIIFPASRMAIE